MPDRFPNKTTGKLDCWPQISFFRVSAEVWTLVGTKAGPAWKPAIHHGTFNMGTCWAPKKTGPKEKNSAAMPWLQRVKTPFKSVLVKSQG